MLSSAAASVLPSNSFAGVSFIILSLFASCHWRSLAIDDPLNRCRKFDFNPISQLSQDSEGAFSMPSSSIRVCETDLAGFLVPMNVDNVADAHDSILSAT